MRLYKLNDIPFAPISHDPELKKQVFIKDRLSCVTNLSHIVFQPGQEAREHVHDLGYEIFYCIRGEITFSISGKEISFREGSCLVVEPGESHALKAVTEAEMVYFFAFKS
jgi:quercetin dioxygenase-like cupin family protein